MRRRSSDSLYLTKRPINPADVIKWVKDESAGGIVLFLGTVRSTNKGRMVEKLEYQTYHAMADRRMRLIEAEVRKRWRVKKVRMVHREGNLQVGEISVAVAVSAEHRLEAFEACRYAIERVKHALPIWKREKIAGGREVWVEGAPIQE